MIERYAVVAGRIRQELVDLERVVARTERAIAAARQRPEDQDLYIYTFEFDLERIEYLVQRLRPSLEQVQVELLAFADFLDQLIQET